ncbi:hypothetical protein ARMSODRAFT_895340, partial [Armillaria solidipes]
YLDEIIRHEGRGDHRDTNSCPDCVARGRNEDDCFLEDLVCVRCCIWRHRQHPLHQIERWTGTFFKCTTLRDIGLRIQLNHSSMFCRNPIAGHQEFVVLYSNGIHKVAVDYCGCEQQSTFH